jgi:hypothetical protein
MTSGTDPFKSYYAKELEQWIGSNPRHDVSVYQIGELFDRAYMKAATAEIATCQRFRQSWVVPLLSEQLEIPHFVVLDTSKETFEENGALPISTRIIPPATISLVRTEKTLTDERKPRTGSAEFIIVSTYRKDVNRATGKGNTLEARLKERNLWEAPDIKNSNHPKEDKCWNI